MGRLERDRIDAYGSDTQYVADLIIVGIMRGLRVLMVSGAVLLAAIRALAVEQAAQQIRLIRGRRVLQRVLQIMEGFPQERACKKCCAGSKSGKSLESRSGSEHFEYLSSSQRLFRTERKSMVGWHL